MIITNHFCIQWRGNLKTFGFVLKKGRESSKCPLNAKRPSSDRCRPSKRYKWTSPLKNVAVTNDTRICQTNSCSMVDDAHQRRLQLYVLRNDNRDAAK